MADCESLEFPLQMSLIGPLLQLPGDEVRAEFMPVWAGQAAPLMRDLPAGRLVETLVAEAQRIIGP
jgi:nitronate monooxygenase